MEAYQWLVCWLAEKTVQTNSQHLRMGKDPFTARNDSQIYNAKALSIAYFEVRRRIEFFWALLDFSFIYSDSKFIKNWIGFKNVLYAVPPNNELSFQSQYQLSKSQQKV